MSEIDLVFACGVHEDPDKARWTVRHAGRTYILCAPGCKLRFEKDPQQFLRHNPRPGIVHTLCGGELDVETAEWTTEFQGRTIYFCASTCQAAFEDDPIHYPETYL